MKFIRNILLMIFIILSYILWNTWQEKSINEKNTNIIVQKYNNKKNQNKSIYIITDLFNLKINLKGGNIEKAYLLKYHKKLNSSKKFCILNIDKNFIYNTQSSVIVKNQFNRFIKNDIPLFSSKYKTYKLADKQNQLIVSLFYISKDNVKYIKNFIFNRNSYFIHVNYNIYNINNAPIEISISNELKQTIDLPDKYKNNNNFSNSYRGTAFSIGNSKHTKYSFKNIKKSNLNVYSHIGWIAMLQKYFAVVWIPITKQKNIFYTKYLNKNEATIGFKSNNFKIKPKNKKEINSILWLGPKIQEEISLIASNLNFINDYNKLGFIALPLFKLLKIIQYYFNNQGIIIIIVTIILRILIFPLNISQYIASEKMKIIHPKMLEIYRKFKNNRYLYNQEIHKLYKMENINPLSGVFALIIQMPIFLSLYHILSNSIELRQATFLWISDLSEKDYYYILPIFMGITMLIIQNISKDNSNKNLAQSSIINYLPILFSCFFIWLPSGLVLYYIISNLITVLQQQFIFKKLVNIF